MPRPKPPRFVVAIEVRDATAVTTETNMRWSGLKRKKIPPATRTTLIPTADIAPTPTLIISGSGASGMATISIPPAITHSAAQKGRLLRQERSERRARGAGSNRSSQSPVSRASSDRKPRTKANMPQFVSRRRQKHCLPERLNSISSFSSVSVPPLAE